MSIKKEIKFKTLSFSEIGMDGFINHGYRWEKEKNTLFHFIDNIETESFFGDLAVKKSIELLSHKKK